MTMKYFVMTLLLLGSMLGIRPVRAASGHFTLIQIGDIHGNLVPRANLRSDSPGHMEGGLARMYTEIQRIRDAHKNSFLVNTGDTIQGSAEALFTRGQAIVDVMNMFGIQAYEPGNWDFLYGPQRFLDLFAGNSPKAPWYPVAANLYYNGAPFADKSGQQVLPPYMIRNIGGLKVGIIGLTTYRGIPAVPHVTDGFKFTGGDAELAKYIPILRDQDKVDALIVISELGQGDNIRLAEKYPGIDAILSSDMHEESFKPAVTKNGTLVTEVGQDGTLVGELNLTITNGKMTGWRWQAHTIDESIPPNPTIAGLVQEVRKSFVSGPDFKPHTNPIDGTVLDQPLDKVVGYTKIPLYRGNFSHEFMPGVLEGSSHDFLTDAIRAVTGADIGAIRGFRYGTEVPPGPITIGDLYHFIPIGPFIAKGTATGQAILNQMEQAADGALDTKVGIWSGGWLFNYSGITADFNPYEPTGKRFSKVMVQRQGAAACAPLDPQATYTYGAYFYPGDPTHLNGLPVSNVTVLKDAQGHPLGAVQAVIQYLQSLPKHTVDPAINRIHLLAPLPPYIYHNPEIQPLKGVPVKY